MKLCLCHWFSGKDIILVSPVQPVTKGEAVTLVCRLREGACGSNVFFHRNDRLIQNHSKSDLKIPAVSESDEGFYKCECSGKVSTTSWMSVKCEFAGLSQVYMILILVWSLILESLGVCSSVAKVNSMFQPFNSLYENKLSFKCYIHDIYWNSLITAAPRHEISSFHGQLIIGLVCGILLISGFVLILLLLFRHQSQSKGELFSI